MSGASTAVLLHDRVHALVDDGSTPAAAGAVVDGRDRAVAAAGHRTIPGGGPAPVRAGADTLFALGSLTKTFTALLLAEMVADDVVAYDDPIEVHLPPEAAPRPGRHSITLADLATHSGGLPRLPRNLYRRALRQWQSDPYARYRVQDLHRATARLRPAPRPRTVRYSTFGIGLLGELLANAAGLPYPDLLGARVLAPLGLRDTCVPTPELLTERAATGHRRGRPCDHWRFDALGSAGALYSTPSDLLRYLQALLSPDSAPAPLNTALHAVQVPWHACPDDQTHKGLGWDIREVRGRTLLWHTGGTGGFTSFFGFSPDASAGVAVLANTTPTRQQPVIRAGRRLFREVVYS